MRSADEGPKYAILKDNGKKKQGVDNSALSDSLKTTSLLDHTKKTKTCQTKKPSRFQKFVDRSINGASMYQCAMGYGSPHNVSEKYRFFKDQRPKDNPTSEVECGHTNYGFQKDHG